MMAISGSLQVYHDVGIGKNHLYANRFKGAVRRDHSSLLHVHLSSHVARLDTSSLCLSDRVHRPLSFVASRCNKLICRACLIPSQANTTPILKPAMIAAVRLYDTLRGNPLFVQLVPAVGIIAFAVWGMGPLLHLSRNLLLQRSDSNWKKSRTHHVMSSYLLPLLLWTGAILVCRAVDPIILPSEASQVVKQRLLIFVRSLSTVLAFAYCLSSLIQSAQKFFMETNDSNDTRNMGFQFAGKAVYTAVWVAAVSLFMELLGFSTQKWLTAGGLGTVLLTLAGREIFTNFLSSAMIHATRPFIVNEWIQTKIEGYEVSGTVEHVGWWSPTIIRGEDREAVHIPNHKFTVNVVRNLTQKTHWRIKTHLAISHLDVNKINNIVSDMRKVLAKNPSVEQQKLHRRVFLDNINPENQALLILISCFVKTSHFEEYLCVKEALLLDLLRVISHHRARLATPIRTVQKVYSDADMDGIAFSETMYSPPREAVNRPFLLIEPSYRVNGDDKSKVQARSTRKNEDQDTKVKADIKVAETPLETKTESKVTGTSPDLKSDHKNVATSTSDSKVNVKATAASSETTKADAKDTVKSTSNLKTPSPVSDIKQSKKTEAGVAHSSKTNIPTKTSVSTTTPGVKTGISAAKSHTKQENDKSPGTSPSPSRPSLEDNIVLGVALEGSKRTLPIEDGMTPPTLQEETKELAATRPAHSGNGSPSGGRKDKKDGNQGPSTAPGVPAGDQREQER